MEKEEIFAKYKDFLKMYYINDLINALKKGKYYLKVDFSLISAFCPEVAEILLENPEEEIKHFERAIADLELEGDLKKVKIRLETIPDYYSYSIRNVRSKHLGKLIQIKGVIKQKTDVRPILKVAKFECPACGNIIVIHQKEDKFKEPTSCGCGRKGKFKLIDKILEDAQRFTLEEATDDLDGGSQPKRINVLLKNDLTSPFSDSQTSPGTKISIIGYLVEIPITSHTGAQLTRFDLLFNANNVIREQDDYSTLEITPEEKERILEFSKDPKVLTKLVKSIAPSIYGMEEIKEALILQLLGGVRKVRKDGNVNRGDIHILLIGDPGSGKSQIIRRMTKVAAKSKFSSGKGTSGAGLTATVVKDEFLRGYALEAGLLVMANKGLAVIDELDKMSEQDISAMHEALEQQTVTIAKANINATMNCQTTVLAAANPIHDRFNPYEGIADQIKLPSTIINRFDLIFPVRDIPDKTRDDYLAKFILSMHQDAVTVKANIDTEFLKKYFAYARMNCHPILTDEAIDEIKEYYVKLRNMNGGGDKEMSAIPISPRQLEALVRLAEASSKVRLGEKVTRKDALKGIKLVHSTITKLGMDPETGMIDIDRFSGGTSTSKRNNMRIIKDLLSEMSTQYEKGLIPVADLIIKCLEKGIKQGSIEKVLETLNREGEIYKPKANYIALAN